MNKKSFDKILSERMLVARECSPRSPKKVLQRVSPDVLAPNKKVLPPKIIEVLHINEIIRLIRMHLQGKKKLLAQTTSLRRPYCSLGYVSIWKFTMTASPCETCLASRSYRMGVEY